MSAFGTKRTYAVQTGMSALPPMADIHRGEFNVCFVPEADIREFPDRFQAIKIDVSCVGKLRSGLSMLFAFKSRPWVGITLALAAAVAFALSSASESLAFRGGSNALTLAATDLCFPRLCSWYGCVCKAFRSGCLHQTAGLQLYWAQSPLPIAGRSSVLSVRPHWHLRYPSFIFFHWSQLSSLASAAGRNLAGR
jgi:hypothetical protein